VENASHRATSLVVPLPNTFRPVKSTSWASHVGRMEQDRNASQILTGKKDHTEPQNSANLRAFVNAALNHRVT